METKHLDHEIERLNLLNRTEDLSAYGQELLTEFKAIKKALNIDELIKTTKEVDELRETKYQEQLILAEFRDRLKKANYLISVVTKNNKILSFDKWIIEKLDAYYKRYISTHCPNCGCGNPKKTYDGYWCKMCKTEI